MSTQSLALFLLRIEVQQMGKTKCCPSFGWIGNSTKIKIFKRVSKKLGHRSRHYYMGNPSNFFSDKQEMHGMNPVQYIISCISKESCWNDNKNPFPTFG
jgi:hypothetical protein